MRALLVLFCLFVASAVAQEPLVVTQRGTAPELLTDRMQVLFDAFEERQALGTLPSSVAVQWNDLRYTLSMEDWWDYRSGQLTFLQVVARVKIAADAPLSPGSLWRRYRVYVGAGLAVFLAAAVLVLLRRTRRRRVAKPASAVTAVPAQTAVQTAPVQESSAAPAGAVLALWPASGGVYPLGREMTSIGAAPSNSIQLTDSGVAAEHARIWRTPDGRYFVESLAAEGVTRVDGVPVAKEWLSPGASIAFGAWEAKAGWWTPPAGWAAVER